MSHFVFGIVGGVALPALTAAATTRHIVCKVGGEIGQPTVHEMLAKQLAEQDGMPFMLTEGEKDDTSDSLVSPYVLGMEGALLGVARCISWAQDVVHEGGYVTLLLTEGYDEQFTELHSDEVLSSVERDAWIPSVKMRFTSGH